jgi:16S rRNA (guanine527-N7)-methyltransferase
VASDWLLRALEESRARGFLGPGPLAGQIEHAEGFIACWEDISISPPGHFLDLGSGGGLPGLVLASHWGLRATLLDSMQKRTSFLRETLTWEGAPAGIEVITGRAEAIARESRYEGLFDLVTARSFGPPSVTTECAVRFLRLGGALIVSEPPQDEPDRWNETVLRSIGLRDQGGVRHNAAFRVLSKVSSTPREFPREVGVPAKRPLF